MLTPDGKRFVWELLAGSIGKLEVSDGTSKAAVVPSSCEATDEGLLIKAVFPSAQGNFDWKIQRVINKAGTVIDEQAQDSGRKVAGGIWNVEVLLAWPKS